MKKNAAKPWKDSHVRYTVRLSRKQAEIVLTALYEWAGVEDHALSGAPYVRKLMRTKEQLQKQLEKAGYYLPLLLALLVTGCGQQTSCRLIPIAGTEKPGFTGSCPSGQVVTGISGSTLTCAEVSVLCPTK